MIEFKQIIGRGTRLYDGKYYFTIHDFVKAHLKFNDKDWDGEPECPIISDPSVPEPEPDNPDKPQPPDGGPFDPDDTTEKRHRIKVKLADGKERSLQHMMATTFWHPDGTPMSAQQFMEALFGKLPEFFHNEAELRQIWSAPDTRAQLLQGLAENGFGPDQLAEMQKIINAENSDLFDVLAHVAYALPTVAREVRADNARKKINGSLSTKQKAFIDFVLTHYITEGVEELDKSKLTPLLNLKYHNSLADAVIDLGKPDEINKLFTDFQKHLYSEVA
jgi:type I restriction enzyme, R subunit